MLSAQAEAIAHESELLKLTLTPEAQKRLGSGTGTKAREVAGEIVVPPTTANGVPTGSLSNLAQIGSQQVAADGEVVRASAQARLARIALTRAENLVREEAGSVRARDEAAAALAAANAALGVARQERQLLGLAVGMLSNQSSVWVRASIFASDLSALSSQATARVRAFGSDNQTRTAQPVTVPISRRARSISITRSTIVTGNTALASVFRSTCR